MSEWIDLTVLIDGDYMVYSGDDNIYYETRKTVGKDGYNLKLMKSNMHVGTHLDVKKHMFDIEEGIESIDINQMIGRATLVQPSIVNGIIDTNDIIGQYEGDNHILLLNCNVARNINTKEYFKQPKFDRNILKFLLKNNISVIGFDLPSPEYSEGDFLDMHRDLLSNNILIIENLTNLDALQKECMFIGLPLKMKGFDGSMLRCVAKNI